MESNDSKDLYLKLYIQKQESLLLDYLRKSFDSDIKVSILEAKLKESIEQYEESQKQVELQNDMMSQAAKGLEAVTIEKNQLQQRVEDYVNTLATVQKEKDTFYQELVKVKEASGSNDKRVNELMLELRKQNEELAALYAENESLKKKLPKPPPELNNKKIKKEPVTLPPDEF